MSVRFNNHSSGDGTNDDYGNDNPFSGEEMMEFITLRRQLSRPTDHYSIKTHRSNSAHDPNPYAPPPQQSHSSHNIANFLRDPLGTTLNSFSRVTNMVLSPSSAYEDWINTPFSIHPPGGAIRSSSPSSAKSPTHCDIGQLSTVNDRNGRLSPVPSAPLPPPALPSIPCTVPQYRLPTLTAEVFNSGFDKMNRKNIFERVFRGGIHDNELRHYLWPTILGLTDDDGPIDWTSLNELFDKYYNQWNSILPDQEMRFTAYRERKSLIERDVIRCDRTHPFYSGTSENLEKLRALLLTYTMYDFDTGYVQGMSDLASPLLYVWNGDVMKAFWCFVQIMKLIGCNFEMSQSSIKYQLEMLWKLIELTDPCFAQYLVAKDSSNCYFAFRWIVCQFKREFMKTKDDEYDDILILWESIWCANIIEKMNDDAANENVRNEEIHSDTIHGDNEKDQRDEENNCDEKSDDIKRDDLNNETSPKQLSKIPDVLICDGTQTSDVPKKQIEKAHQRPTNLSHTLTKNNDWKIKNEKRLTDVQLYISAICLSIIRRERDLIMSRKLDATEILKHFNNLQLNDDLWNVLLHASTIWYWLKNDYGESLLYKELEQPQHEPNEDFDLLNESLNDEDYYIINSPNV